MTAGMKFCIVCLAAMFICACSLQDGILLVPDNYPELVERYPGISKLPFPAVTSTSYKYLASQQYVPRLQFAECPPFTEPPKDAVCVGREILVPAVTLHSMVAELSLDDARSYFTGGSLPAGVMIVPLSSLELPLRAIPVGGLYINDAGYPLVNRLYASVSLPEDSPPGYARAGGLIQKVRAGLDRLKTRELAAAAKAWLGRLEHAGDKLYKNGEALAWVVSVGDVMPGRGIEEILRTEHGVEKVFSSTLSHLRQGAITACNFETVLSQGKGAIAKSYNFYVPPWVLPYLHEAGFTYLTLTNNHVWDYGQEGFVETLDIIKKSPLSVSGVGLNLEEASLPWNTVLGTTKCKVLSVAAYPREKNGFDGKTLAAAEAGKPGILFSGKGAEEAMRAHFSAESFDIVFVHGGIEAQTYPGKAYEALYRSFVDLGADLVVGSHPHVLQRMETYRGKLIAYSLGNFIFAGMDDVPGGEDAVILKVGVSGLKIVYVEAVPVKLSYTGVTVKSGTEALLEFLSLP